MKLRNVIYKTNNIIIQQKQESLDSKTCIIMGSGYNVSIDEKDNIIYSDPLFFPPTGKGYGNHNVLSVFFTFECAGLEVAGKEIAAFINENMNGYNNIVLHGHSKCGCCFLNLAQWLNRTVSIVSVSAPINFYGTPITDSQFHKKLSKIEAKIFGLIFSDHNVDRDLSRNSEFLKTFNPEGLKKHKYKVIVSSCGGVTFNPVALLLTWFDKSKGVNGDGIIPKKSQIPYFCNFEKLESTHAESMRKSVEFVKSFL